MNLKRTDDPRPVTFKLSAEARRLLDATADAIATREGNVRRVTKTEVVERAIRLLARKEKVA